MLILTKTSPSTITDSWAKTSTSARFTTHVAISMITFISDQGYFQATAQFSVNMKSQITIYLEIKTSALEKIGILSIFLQGLSRANREIIQKGSNISCPRTLVENTL